jgi:WD40 repeat protein
MITRFGPSGASVASGDQQGLLSVSRWQTSQLLWQHCMPAAITALAWSHDGAYLASGDAQGQIQVWEARTGTLVQSSHGHHSAVAHLAWAPNTYHLTSSASRESVLRIWDYTPLLRAGSARDGTGEEARSC